MTETGVIEAPPVSSLIGSRESTKDISKTSATELENFVDGETILVDLGRSLLETTKMDLIAEQFPDLKERAAAAKPAPEDYQRASVTKGDWMNALKTTPKEAERRRIVEDAFPAWTGETGKFLDEARVGAALNAIELRNQAKEAMDTYLGGDGFVRLSTYPEVATALLQKGRYVSRLDETGRESYNSKLEDRAKREIELGIYLPDGITKNVPRPVYGRMVIGPQSESERNKFVGEGYGGVDIKFKRRAIEDRTNFSVGDSVVDRDKYGAEHLLWEDAEKARFFLDRLITNPNVDWRGLPPYIEAQITGGVLTEDIEEIRFMSSGNTKELETVLLSDPSRFRVEKNNNEWSISFI